MRKVSRKVCTGAELIKLEDSLVLMTLFKVDLERNLFITDP